MRIVVEVRGSGVSAPTRDVSAKLAPAFECHVRSYGIFPNAFRKNLVVDGASDGTGCRDLHDKHLKVRIGQAIGSRVENVPR